MRKENGVYRKSFYCRDLEGCSDGERIFDIFLLSKMAYTSNIMAVKWFVLRLEDRTGSIRGKIWADKMKMEYESYEGQIVFVKGYINYYAGRPEVTVEQMEPVKEAEYDLGELCRALSPEKEEAYKKQMACITRKIVSENLRNYVEKILDEETVRKMAGLPVHLKGHHTYRGALLEHVCEVATAAYYQARTTDAVRENRYDLDLVIAGALLHDLASLVQYEAQGYRFKEKSSYKLAGRPYASFFMLDLARKEAPVDDGSFSQLLHVVDAAHERGPEPMTMEAMIVRSANILSAKLEQYENTCMVNSIYGYHSEEILWSRELKREIYRKERN